MHTLISRISGFFLIGMLCTGALALGAEPMTYDGKAFADAQDAGKKIILDFHSTRCSSCLKQEQALRKILDDKKLQGVQWFVVKYEGESDMSKQYEVDHASLLLFKGKEQVGRSHEHHVSEKNLRKLLLKTFK